MYTLRCSHWSNVTLDQRKQEMRCNILPLASFHLDATVNVLLCSHCCHATEEGIFKYRNAFCQINIDN